MIFYSRQGRRKTGRYGSVQWRGEWKWFWYWLGVDIMLTFSNIAVEDYSKNYTVENTQYSNFYQYLKKHVLNWT